MMTLPKTAEVVIIGGGVMGASTAYHLAARGCTDVVLLEKEEFWGTGATGRCAGGIRHQFSTEINIRLSLLSLQMLRRFEDEIGQAIDLRWPGYLFLLTRPEDVDRFRRHVALQHRLGVQTRWLAPDDVARRIPLIRTDDVLAATYNAGDGLADPAGVVQGYVDAAGRLGVKTLTGVEVTGVTTRNSRVCGVQTGQGLIQTPVIVNAAGPWAGLIGEMAGIDIPIVPLRRQIAVTTALPEVPPDFPFVIDFAQSLYFHREGEGILTGQSNPHEQPGFDQTVDQDWTARHLTAAIDRFPLLAKAGLLAEWAGLYEVTPDAHPILGRVPDLEGFIIAAGFSGHGFMHGPITGLLVAEIILDGAAHTLDIGQLNLARFREKREIREMNVV
ncbi:MAG: NAD(P)/FAD-dependent oxidoreductase [Anaerolineae bacterium]